MTLARLHRLLFWMMAATIGLLVILLAYTTYRMNRLESALTRFQSESSRDPVKAVGAGQRTSGDKSVVASISEAKALAIAQKRIEGGRAMFDYRAHPDGAGWRVYVTPFEFDELGSHVRVDDSDGVVVIDSRGKIVEVGPAL